MIILTTERATRQKTEQQSASFIYGLQDRAKHFGHTTSQVIKHFDRLVNTQAFIEEAFDNQANVVYVKGSASELFDESRPNPYKTYINGYWVRTVGIYKDMLPNDGCFVGFIGKRESLLPSGNPSIFVTMPEHWGVIGIMSLIHKPFEMAARLGGVPIRNRFSAENLRLHERLDPRKAGWEKECGELKTFLSQSETVNQARSVVEKGLLRVALKNIRRSI